MKNGMKSTWDENVKLWNCEVVPLLEKFRTDEMKAALNSLWDLHGKMEIACHGMYDIGNSTNPVIYEHLKALSDLLMALKTFENYMLNKI